MVTFGTDGGTVVSPALLHVLCRDEDPQSFRLVVLLHSVARLLTIFLFSAQFRAVDLSRHINGRLDNHPLGEDRRVELE